MQMHWLLMTNTNPISISPIGFIRSPYKEKFAVPRQPGLAPDAVSVIEFYPPYNDELAFEGIDGFSHIHVIFLFDKIDYSRFKPKVRPPRLGGNVSVGVFSTRSPFRPNRLGLSILKIHRVIREKGKVSLEVLGADLVDNTPIIDIKPYIPFVDSVPDAVGGFASAPPPMHEVVFENDTESILKTFGEQRYKAVCQTLSQDPRPAYKDDTDEKSYVVKIYSFTINFKVKDSRIHVFNVNIDGESSC